MRDDDNGHKTHLCNWIKCLHKREVFMNNPSQLTAYHNTGTQETFNDYPNLNRQKKMVYVA